VTAGSRQSAGFRRPTVRWPPAPDVPAYAPPTGAWQQSAREAIKACQANLWNEPGQKALGYLVGRGFIAGHNPLFQFGLFGGRGHRRAVYSRGIVIPCAVAGEVWYLKIRLPAHPGEQKYTCVKGSRPAAIFNADELRSADVALFCEGEFDCMVAWQELRSEFIPCVTLGSATNTPDLATWGYTFLPLKIILSAYDADKAGEKGAAMLADLAGDRVKLALLRMGEGYQRLSPERVQCSRLGDGLSRVLFASL